MEKLLNNISNADLVTITILMSIVALLLAVAISIEIYKNSKKTGLRILSSSNDLNTINIKEVEGINYVDDDAELEKTKARLELAELKERLRREEIEKSKLLELNIALAKNNKSKEEVKETIVEENKVVQVVEEIVEKPIEVKETIIEKTIEPVIVETKKEQEQEIVIEKDKVDIEINNLEEEHQIDTINDEESAIISFDELKTSVNTALSMDGTVKYEDEKTAVISISELQKLYEESSNIGSKTTNKEVELMTFDVKKVDDLPKIKDYSSFQTTPFISPVHGLTQTENDIILTSTANLERLNKEIKKTNEFLQALKVLKKNLD